MEARNDTNWRVDEADVHFILLCTFELSGVELAEWPEKEDED